MKVVIKLVVINVIFVRRNQENALIVLVLVEIWIVIVNVFQDIMKMK